MVEIARKLEMNTSTCHNTLRTLRDEGLVHFDRDLKLYGLGLPLITSLDRLRNIDWGLYPALSWLQDLSDRLSVTVIMGEITGLGSIRILSRTYPKGSMAVSISDFETVPLLSGAMGRVVAAWSSISDAAVKALFDESRHLATTSLNSFVHDVAHARTIGWAIDNGTWQRGIWGMAAPVPKPGDGVEHILCITCAAGAVSPERISEMGEELVRTARMIADRTL